MFQGANNTYFGDLLEGIRSSIKGLRLSFKHIRDARWRRNNAYVNQPNYFTQDTGMVTLRYPLEALPVPDHGRYQLHNEMDDCIVCDKCAKICPVDCIEIEPIKSSEVIGHTSDGSPIRLYAATFDIDMAKCCFCGLCTTVCPTECLTMTNQYDFSTFDITQLNFAFANLTPEQADEKRVLYEQFVREKEEAKKKVSEKTEVVAKETADSKEEVKKPVFKPTFKRPAEPIPPAESMIEAPDSAVIETTEDKPIEPAKKVFKPTFKKPTG